MADVPSETVRAEMPIQWRAATPQSWDSEARTFTVVASTGAKVRRMDWEHGEYEESLGMEPGNVRLSEIGGGPFLDSHDRWSTTDVLGTVERGWLEDGKLMAQVRLAKGDERADSVANKIDQGILKRISIGYRVYRMEEVGRRKDGQPRHLRAVDWEPFEVSIVAIPADRGAGIRSGEASNPCDVVLAAEPPAHPEEKREMTTAPAVEAPVAPTQPAVKDQDRADKAPPVDMDKVRKEAITAERLRVAGITATTRKLKLGDDFAQRHIDEGTALDEFRSAAIDEAAKRGEEPAPVQEPVQARAYPEPAEKPEKGINFGKFVRALAANKGHLHSTAEWSKSQFGERHEVTTVFKRALAAGTSTAGGFLVPEQYQAEIIELLRPASVVRRMGAVNPPMPGGTLTWPRLSGGSTSGYIGENQNLPVTEPDFEQLKLYARKLGAIVPISNDLLRFSSPQADAVVRDDLVASIAQTEDAAFIRSQGSGNAPKGLRYWAPTANRLTVNATVNLANVTTDLGAIILALRNANVRMLRPGWLMAPRTENYLMTVRDGNGNFAFRDEMLQGRLWRYPYATTTQIPINLAVTGTNESELYFVDFADVIIADVPGMVIDTSSEAAYTTDGGTTHKSAYQLDQTIIRAITMHDMGVRHDASVAVFTDVDWI